MDKKLEAISIDWGTVGNIVKFDVHYDKTNDIFLVQTKEDRTAISIDCDGEYWVRVDPQTGEILGIEIEDFKKVFLKKHAKEFREDDIYVRPLADIIQTEKCPA